MPSGWQECNSVIHWLSLALRIVALGFKVLLVDITLMLLIEQSTQLKCLAASSTSSS